MRAILVVAAFASPASASPWWVSPFDRAAWQLAAFDEADRPYSTDVKPRDIAGDVALSCEHVEGRPCGHGVGTSEELDSAAGYGGDALAFVRLRAHGGTGAYDNGLDLDRAFVRARHGAFAIEAGRDVLAFGPAAHTTVGWGDNAPPLDHVHVAFATARGSLTYVVGRLRDPQTYPGNLVTIARGTLVLGDVTLGGQQLLQLEGDGAPHLGLVDFITEHVTRGNPSAGPDDTSNRRVGLDVDWRIAGFDGARIYYELMFEDWRRQFADALRYDADHVVGMVFSHGLVVEWQKTGFRSMEHTPRITGFTNAGRAVGSPLGPDAQALYVAERLRGITPWLEIARLASDSYEYGFHQPIIRFTDSVAEKRYRAGAHMTVPVSNVLHMELDAMVEHVEDFAFIRGERRENIGARMTLVWLP